MYDMPTANERPNDKRYFHTRVLTPARRQILADPQVREMLRTQTMLKAGDDATLRAIPIAVAEAVATETAARRATAAAQPKDGLNVTTIAIVGAIGVAAFFLLK